MAGRITVLLIALVAAGGQTFADEPISTFFGLGKVMKEEALAMPTLGGRVFWGDVLHFRGFRIQQNVISKHYRLLDASDRRFASGSYDECAAKLAEIKQERELKPLEGKVVILVHGMGRSSKSWPKMSKALEAAGYQVVPFDYPSTRCAISDSAGYLAQVIGNLDGVEEINFVCHSMGGLVVRAYAANHSDDRIKRMVMLAVPNLGAEMADIVAKWPLYQWVCGPGGCELVTDPEGLIASLPTPDFEFAVIAAGKGNSNGYNPLIAGDDDGTVTVASTRLPGATDFLQVNGLLHSFLMFDNRVIDATVRFFDEGKLRAEGDSEPIPREPVDAEPAVAVQN
jgi:pimeloyl-ACP methyl ester carboxylesterase